MKSLQKDTIKKIKTVFRKDRNMNGGGVFISVHDRFNTVTVESDENDSELQWTEVQTKEKSVLT